MRIYAAGGARHQLIIAARKAWLEIRDPRICLIGARVRFIAAAIFVMTACCPAWRWPRMCSIIGSRLPRTLYLNPVTAGFTDT